MRRSQIPLLILLCLAIFCLLSLPSYKTSISTQFIAKDVDLRVKPQFHEWKTCLETDMSTYRNDAKQLWKNLRKGVALCERLPFMARLKILDFRNSDETKRHIPSLQQKPSIIVTLGIGHDTAAEEAVQKVLPRGSLFYGADPIHEVNEELFSKFGTYFPFAVGAKSQISNADVLINGSYVTRSVIHIDLVYFLKEIVGHEVYDDLWIDAEGAEYELFPYFYREGKLDQHGITLCQFNMEEAANIAKAESHNICEKKRFWYNYTNYAYDTGVAYHMNKYIGQTTCKRNYSENLYLGYWKIIATLFFDPSKEGICVYIF